MSNKWNFKIDLKDENVFTKLEDHYGLPIPQGLKSFILEANASNPEENLIMINGVERIFETVLSYNEIETEAVSVFDILNNDKCDHAIPFGTDPFGNLFYCSLKDDKVLFYNHEEDVFEDTNYSFEEFISSLYM